MQNPYLDQSISHATLRSEDLLERFANTLEELSILNKTEKHTQLINDARDIRKCLIKNPTPEVEEQASYIINDEFYNAFDDFTPEGYYFGAHVGDGSDFGFWQDEEYNGN